MDPEKEKTPTPKKRRRKRGSLSQAEILTAALDIIRAESVEALSMRAIAARLKCSVASPYTHFANQREIFTALLRQGEQDLRERLQAATIGQEDVYEKLEALAYAYWQFARDNRGLHKLMYHQEGVSLQRELSPGLTGSYKIFLKTVREGVTSGQIRFPKNQYLAITRTIWSWIYGVLALDLNGLSPPNSGRGKTHPMAEGIHFFKLLLKNGETTPFMWNARFKQMIQEKIRDRLGSG